MDPLPSLFLLLNFYLTVPGWASFQTSELYFLFIHRAAVFQLLGELNIRGVDCALIYPDL